MSSKAFSTTFQIMRSLSTIAILLIVLSAASAWTPFQAPANKPSFVKTGPNLATAASLFILAPLVVFGSAAHAADVAAGQQLFVANCAACHAGGQNAVLKEKTLQKDALELNVGLDAGKIQSFVQNSAIHRGALLFAGKLTDADYANVASFVLDQAVENKW